MIINNIPTGTTNTDHQTSDKARVATAVAPKTRISNATIASDAPLVNGWVDELAEGVEKDKALGVVVADDGKVVLLEEVDEDKTEDAVEEAEDGEELAEGALPSTAFPQGIGEPSG